MSTFTDFTQAARSQDRDMWLGVLTYYTVSDLSVHHDKLLAAMTEVGLDDHVPSAPSNMDVFRRISAAGARKRVPTTDPERHNNFLIRELSHGGGTVNRRIVCETVDLGGQRLDYVELVELVYESSVGRLTLNKLGDCIGDDCETAWGIAQTIKHDFAEQSGCHGSYTVRSLVRNIVLKQHATALRDGLYFVPSPNADKVDALEKLSALVPGMFVHSFPLLDDAKQRANVRAAFEAESIDEVDRTVGEIVELVGKGDEITFTRYADFQRRYEALMEKTLQYSNLLEEGVATTEIRLNILGREMRELLKKVKK